MLYDKWWKNTGDVCNRDDKNKESKASALGIENIGEKRIAFNVLVRHIFAPFFLLACDEFIPISREIPVKYYVNNASALSLSVWTSRFYVNLEISRWVTLKVPQVLNVDSPSPSP